jgi:hypothetical protein
MLNKPPRNSVYIKNLGKNLYLNFISIDDEDYLEEQFPKNSFMERINKGDVDAILIVFWWLLDDEAKQNVVDYKVVKWNGLKKVTKEYTDPVKKLRAIISGADEITAIAEAIFNVKIKSNPDTKENEKKKTKAADRLLTQK